METYVDCSWVKIFTKHAVVLVGSFEPAPRPGTFTILDFHKLSVPLIGCEPNGVSYPGQRLVGWCCC